MPYELMCGSDPRSMDLSVVGPDGSYMLCTGGTTGLPKAVLWRQADVSVAVVNDTQRLERRSRPSRR